MKSTYFVSKCVSKSQIVSSDPTTNNNCQGLAYHCSQASRSLKFDVPIQLQTTVVKTYLSDLFCFFFFQCAYRSLKSHATDRSCRETYIGRLEVLNLTLWSNFTPGLSRQTCIPYFFVFKRVLKSRITSPDPDQSCGGRPL